jgi:hypothetical protein
MIIILEDDDNRIKKFVALFPSAQIVKTAKECIDILDRQVARQAMSFSNKICDLLMLDHDLSGEIYVDPNSENTGSEVVRWIEKYKPYINEIIVHSYNHPAAMVMTETLISCGYDAKRIPFNYDWEVTHEKTN